MELHELWFYSYLYNELFDWCPNVDSSRPNVVEAVSAHAHISTDYELLINKGKNH